MHGKMIGVVAASLLIPAWSAFAEPIPPVPLWQLVERAEKIVVARVATVTPIEGTDENHWDTALAHLAVLETWKGEKDTDLEIPFPANMICPAPPVYAEGEIVTAFLARDQDRGNWQTVGLSYGTLYPAADELDDMRTAVSSALAIQSKMSTFKGMKSERRDWAVAAAAKKATRWHGLFELSPRSDRLHAYYDGESRARLAIDAAGQRVLAEAFVAAPLHDATLGMMLDVLAGDDDPRVTRQAIGIVEGLLRLEKVPYWTVDLVGAVVRRHGGNPERFLDPGRFSYDVARLREVWRVAKTELDIAEIPPATIEFPKGYAVGGYTPD